MLKKKLSNDSSLEVNIAISQKKNVLQFFDRKNDRKRNEQKS